MAWRVAPAGSGPSRIASHQWAIRILTAALGGLELRALTVDRAAIGQRTLVLVDRKPLVAVHIVHTTGLKREADVCTV